MHSLIHTHSCAASEPLSGAMGGEKVGKRGLTRRGLLLAEFQQIWVTDFTPPCNCVCCGVCGTAAHAHSYMHYQKYVHTHTNLHFCLLKGELTSRWGSVRSVHIRFHLLFLCLNAGFNQQLHRLGSTLSFSVNHEKHGHVEMFKKKNALD